MSWYLEVTQSLQACQPSAVRYNAVIVYIFYQIIRHLLADLLVTNTSDHENYTNRKSAKIVQTICSSLAVQI